MTSRRLPRRLVAAMVVAGVTLVSAEFLSFLALWWLAGTPHAVRALGAARSQLVAEAAARAGAGGGEEAGPGEASSTPPSVAPRPFNSWHNLLDDPAHAQRVIHPYLGFVYDEGLNRSADRRRAGYPEISDLGFYAAGADAPPGQPAFIVDVFGGSMAMLVALEGREALARELRRARSLAGRTIVVRCFALGGYKQPQQLLALAYLLALGERPDAAVNLDGLNEVALPYAENRPRGVFPLFPRGWDALVEKTTNPVALEAAGRVAYLRALRVRLARLFSARPLAISSTANLLWRSLDQRLALRVANESLALAQAPSGAPSFAADGPRWSSASDADFLAGLARCWQTSSLAMARLAAGSGIRYYHFLQPNQFDPGAKPIGPAEAAVALDPASPFREPVRRAYPLLSGAGRELRAAGVRFHDLRAIFAHTRAPLYVDTCCHVSRQGNALLAAAIGRAVREDLDASLRPAAAPPATGSSR